MKKPKEYDLIKSKLKNEIQLKEYDLVLTLDSKDYGNFPITGGDTLKNIWWYRYNFNKTYKGYDYINLMFFKITEEKRQEAVDNKAIFTSTYLNLPNYPNVCMSRYPKSHIDGGTGNIHPGFDFVKNKGYKYISQLVLCKNRPGKEGGPNTPEINEKDIYNYSTNKVTIKVHKSCYYPRIDNKIPINDWRHNLLKDVSKQLPKEYIKL